ncbi:chromosome partitioning protein ParB [Pantoea graminicola]|uniref:dATP/dGTP pyrophosphohydrolase domain-containing protein n=1 Tax=Pantoea sp. ARC607 TaxID=2027922 RepID=UPI000DA82B31|nr:dATP/dGTP pyrophosphohydrolase domain-containing protein [Pantoea sp. ARC607]PZL93161.1 chromosome partitioning protein ParB [Pantoea sp. ARC607]
MSTLARIYDDKKNSDTDITTRKTYLLGVDELYVETNYNIRDIDQTHVEEFRDAFIAGEHVPPLAVKVTEKGIKIIDGHHRYYGAKLAQDAGYTLRLECKDFVGSEADSVAFMVTSSQGRALLPLERAVAYQRLVNQGLEPGEIAAKVKRSITDVEQHLQLLTVGEPLIEMVKSGEVAATTAVALQREHGVKASSVAQEQMQKAKAAGKKKLTRSAAIVSPAKLREKIRAEHAAWSQETFGDVGPIGPLKHLAKEAMEAAEAPEDLSEWANLQFLLWDAMRRAGITEEELNAAMELKLSVNKARNWPEPKDGEPREHLKADSEEAIQPEKDYGDDLPLLKHEILEQSGVEAWACVIAAFKMKAEYTYSESKYAHTWAADSVENPTCVTVPVETIAKAMRLIKQHQDDLELKLWLSEQHDDSGLASEQLQRFSAVLSEIRQDKPCTVQEFIGLVEQTNRDCWSNIRMLRQAVREIAGQHYFK